MSKSRGNAVDPLDWIDRFGADATRFTLARGANPGSDVPVSDEWAEGSRNFCNKLWNAARFALVPRRGAAGAAGALLSVPDRWILSRLSTVIAEVDQDIERFEFAKGARRSTTSPGTTFATGLELAKRAGGGSGSAGARPGRRGAAASRPPGTCSGLCWTTCSGCCIRSCRS